MFQKGLAPAPDESGSSPVLPQHLLEHKRQNIIAVPEGMNPEEAWRILEMYQAGEMVQVPEGMDPLRAQSVLTEFHTDWQQQIHGQ